MKRSAIKRGKGFKARKSRANDGERGRPSLSKRSAKKLREAGEKKRKALKKVGKKGRESARALRAFKKECARLNLDERCERRGPNCTGTEQLTWAHGRKRAELKKGELESFAIICCVNCHREMDEGMTHEGMANEVSRIIALRPERYLEAA